MWSHGIQVRHWRFTISSLRIHSLNGFWRLLPEKSFFCPLYPLRFFVPAFFFYLTQQINTYEWFKNKTFYIVFFQKDFFKWEWIFQIQISYSLTCSWRIEDRFIYSLIIFACKWMQQVQLEFKLCPPLYQLHIISYKSHKDILKTYYHNRFLHNHASSRHFIYIQILRVINIWLSLEMV